MTNRDRKKQKEKYDLTRKLIKHNNSCDLILKYPNPILKTVSTEYNIDTDKELITKHIHTMKSVLRSTLNGVGLAANQVGITKKIFVYRTSLISEIKVCINPEITWRSEEKEIGNEGCLSYPKVFADIPRSKEIEITYYNEKFQLIKEKVSGFKARVMDHENDHLWGNCVIEAYI